METFLTRHKLRHRLVSRSERNLCRYHLHKFDLVAGKPWSWTSSTVSWTQPRAHVPGAPVTLNGPFWPFPHWPSQRSHLLLILALGLDQLSVIAAFFGVQTIGFPMDNNQVWMIWGYPAFVGNLHIFWMDSATTQQHVSWTRCSLQLLLVEKLLHLVLSLLQSAHWEKNSQLDLETWRCKLKSHQYWKMSKETLQKRRIANNGIIFPKTAEKSCVLRQQPQLQARNR